MKKILFPASVLLSIAALSSCGSKVVEGTGDYVTKYFETSDAVSLNVSDIQLTDGSSLIPVTLSIEKSDTKSISVTAQESILDVITVESGISEIHISGKAGYKYNTSSLSIHISGYTFSDVDLELTNGTFEDDTISSDVSVSLSKASSMVMNQYEGKNFSASLNDASELLAKTMESSYTQFSLSDSSSLEIDSLSSTQSDLTLSSSQADVNYSDVSGVTITASNSSTVNANGIGNNVDLVFSSGSMFYGKNMSIYIATVMVSGSSNLFIRAEKSINIVATGASVITYYGSPSVTKTSITDQTIIEQGEE